MSLIWHLAWRDIRRMALPVTLWLAFQLFVALWFAFNAAAGSVLLSVDVVVWSNLAEVVSGLSTLLQVVFCYFMIGTMVVDDPLVGSSAFWMTRPIANARRAAGIAVSALLLFVVLPLLPLLGVWLAAGFSGGELVVASVALVRAQLGIVIVALAIAAISRSLAQYLFSTVGLLAAYGVCRLPLFALDDHLSSRLAHDHIIAAGLMPVAVVALVHQVLRRRTVHTLVFLGTAFVAALAIRFGWRGGDAVDGLAALETGQPLALDLRLAEPASSAPDHSSDSSAAASVHVGSAPAHGWQHWPKEVEVTLPARPSALPVPLDGAIDAPNPTEGSQTIVRLKLAQLSDADVSRLATNQSFTAARWTMAGLDVPLGQPPPEAPELHLALHGYLARVVGVESLPTPPDILRIGARRTRVITTEVARDGSAAILIQEWDAFSRGFWTTVWSGIGRQPTAFQHEDVFALVNPATHEVRSLRSHDLGAAGFDAMLVGFRRVEIPAEFRKGTWRNANLVRVRLDLGDEFHAGTSVNLANEGQQTP